MTSTSARTEDRLESNAPDLTLIASWAWRMTCGPWMAGRTLAGSVVVAPLPVWSGTPLAVEGAFDRDCFEPYWVDTAAWLPLELVAPPPPQAAAASKDAVNNARTTSNRFMRPPPDLMKTKRGRDS